MSKDRNTFAKRQREVERKRKADQKKDRRLRRKQTAVDSVKTDTTSEDDPGLQTN